MATLIATADGNLTGSTTFAAAETGTSALAMIRANNSSIATPQSQTSPSFTVTSAKVIDGVLLWLWISSGTVGTATFKVDLQKGGVSQASVTVNQSDLPPITLAAPAPVFFKFTGTATGDGGSNWTLVVTTVAGTGNANIIYSRNSATTNDFTRALRTTTTAAPAAADDLYVVGEFTGAGTHNSRAVTMDSTAATAYGNGVVNSTSVNGGGVRVGAYGTLSYGTSASTNYLLRINGDLEVYWNGTFNMGSSGSEIPRTSTAVLEFQQTSASGDFGLRCRDNSTVNIAGLSRTSAKNVVQCKLTSDVTGSNVLNSGPTVTNGTNTAAAGLDFSGTSLLASTLADTATNATHSLAYSGPSITNTTQTGQVWLARGSGTNNRFVRLTVGNNTVFGSVTKGFFADIDLQAGTIGTCTAIGTGTATSASIAAVGNGFLCTITGKVDASAATPSLLINICSAAGTTSFAGAANQSLLYEGLTLVSASSIGDTTFNVNADTGWLSGDVICVASTTRTASDCEGFNLSANAGASSLVTHLYPFGYGGPTANLSGTHSGTSPTQAEVGLLTRNVKIRSTSTTLATFVYCTALSTINFSWAEFYYIGVLATSKHGIEIDAGATANAKSITFCSLHDCISNGFYCNTNSSTSLNLTFSNNVGWNSLSSIFLTISSTLTNTDWTFSSNLLMKGAAAGFSLSDHGGVCSGNTAVGFTNGFQLNETGTASAIGTFDSNSTHSNSQPGLSLGFTYSLGTISNFSSWRNNNTGITCSSNSITADLYFTNLTLFGNFSSSGNLSWNGDTLHISGGTIAGDTSFAVASGIIVATNPACTLDLKSVDMSGTGTGLAAHTTADITVSVTINSVQGIANNCKFGAPTPIVKTAWAKGAYIGLEKYNQTAGDHRTEMTYGQLKTDTSFFNTASPSMRMTPNNASNKLESSPCGKGWKVPVSSGNTAAIAVYIYKSKTGDGAAYNGNQPRLIQRANPALGQSSNVVLATYSSSTGSWNQLSANTSTATDDGAWEIIVDCDGTAGWINVDDLQVA